MSLPEKMTVTVKPDTSIPTASGLQIPIEEGTYQAEFKALGQPGWYELKDSNGNVVANVHFNELS